MLKIADKYFGEEGPAYIDLGSGMYGMMNEYLKDQFSNVPSYEDYAREVAGLFAKHYTKEKARGKDPCFLRFFYRLKMILHMKNNLVTNVSKMLNVYYNYVVTIDLFLKTYKI